MSDRDAEGLLHPRHPSRLADTDRRPAAVERPDLPDRDVHHGRRRRAGRRHRRRPGRLRLLAPLQPDQPRAGRCLRRARRWRRPGRRWRRAWARSTPRSRPSCGQATGSSRRRPPTARRGSCSAGTSRRFGVRVDFVDMTDNAAAAARDRRAPPRGRVRRDHRQPDDRGDRPRDARRGSPTSTARPTSSTTPSPRRTFAGRSSSAPISSSSRRRSSSAGHSDVIAGVVAGRRDLVDAVEAVQNDTGGDDRPVRRVPRPARHPDARPSGWSATPRTAAALARLARASGRRASASCTRACRATPSTMSPSASSATAWPAGCSPFEVEGGRDAGRAIIDAHGPPRADRLARERPHDGRPPAVDLAAPAVRGGADRVRVSRPACCASRSGSRTSRTSRPTSRPRSRPRGDVARRATGRRLRRLPVGDTGRRPVAASAARRPDQPASPSSAGACGGYSRRSTSRSPRSSSWPSSPPSG